MLLLTFLEPCACGFELVVEPAGGGEVRAERFVFFEEFVESSVGAGSGLFGCGEFLFGAGQGSSGLLTESSAVREFICFGCEFGVQRGGFALGLFDATEL